MCKNTLKEEFKMIIIIDDSSIQHLTFKLVLTIHLK